MNKTLLTIAALALSASAANAQFVQAPVTLERASVKTSVAESLPMVSPKADTPTSLDFSLAYEPYTSLSLNNTTAGNVVYQIAEFGKDLTNTYEGTQITSFNLYAGTNGSQTSAKNLVTEVTVFLADDIDAEPFYTQKATLSSTAFGLNKIKLDTPYTVTKDKPFVYGYTITLTSQTTKAYYIVVDGMPTEELAGSYVGLAPYAGGEIEWMDGLNEVYGSLNIGLTLTGSNLPMNCVDVLEVVAPSIMQPGVAGEFDLMVVGKGANAATSMDVEITIGNGHPQPAQFDLSKNPASFNTILMGTVGDIVCNEEGTAIPYEFKITKVNGQPNTSTNNVASGLLMCFDSKNGFPRKHLIEEGTGTWCGWCPAGIVMMEYLKATYPEDVVRVALHCSNGPNAIDPMQVESVVKASSYLFSGFPQAYLNREVSLSPTALATTKSTIQSYVANKIPSPIQIGSLQATCDNANKVEIKNTVKFALDADNSDNRFRMAYYITEDGVGPFMQTNYYAPAYGQNQTMEGWEKKGASVSTIYEDVARDLVGEFQGVAGSIPAAIEASKEYEVSTTASAEFVSGDSMYVTAFVIDNLSGAVLNAEQIEIKKDNSGVNDIADSAVAVKVSGRKGAVAIEGNYTSASVYNLSGALVATPEGSEVELPAGVYVVNVDGKAVKVLVK